MPSGANNLSGLKERAAVMSTELSKEICSSGFPWEKLANTMTKVGFIVVLRTPACLFAGFLRRRLDIVLPRRMCRLEPTLKMDKHSCSNEHYPLK